MRTVHKTTIVAKCPHGAVDVYEAEFHVGGVMVAVEQIAAVIDRTTREPIYQEALTEALGKSLGCKVITRGWHGVFHTVCEYES